MSALGTDLRDMGLGLVNRVLAVGTALGRASVAVLGLRVGVLAGLFGGFLLTAAAPLGSFVSGVVLVGALLAALFPRGAFTGLVMIFVALLWLAWDPAPSLPQVLGLAVLLYVAHACAALAGTVPYDCVISRTALSAWARRVLGVVAASLALGSLGLLLVDRLAPVSSIIGPMVGALVAAAITGLLTWLPRRRAS